MNTEEIRSKWVDWVDATLDPQTLRGDLFQALDEIDRLRGEEDSVPFDIDAPGPGKVEVVKVVRHLVPSEYMVIDGLLYRGFAFVRDEEGLVETVYVGRES